MGRGWIIFMGRLSQRRTTLCILFAVLMSSAGTGLSVAAKPKPATITIRAKQFAFVPEEITVHVGQPVRLVFVSDDVPHAITVAGLPIDLPITRKPASVILTPEKIAEFTGMCSRYCGEGHDEMKLTIHVVP